ncbi:hypothetical protein PPM_1216 [Paenibacillus polymyxa M1]|nr:hypothetical protein PPM_1216 [Paenibacillus polymyxa M1]
MSSATFVWSSKIIVFLKQLAILIKTKQWKKPSHIALKGQLGRFGFLNVGGPSS